MANPLHSFRTGIALSFGVAILLLSISLSVFIGGMARTYITNDIHRQMRDLAENLAIDLDHGMYERYANAKSLASMLEIDQEQDANQQRLLLEEFQNIYPDYSWIGLADPSGKIVVDTGGYLTGEDASSRPWFVSGIEAPFVGDIHDASSLADVLQSPPDKHIRLVDIAMPIHTPSGEVGGVLGIHLNWDWAHRIYQNLLTVEMVDSNTELFILNNLNEIILGPQNYEGGIPESLFDELSTSEKLSFTTDWQDQSYLTGVAHTTGYLDYPGLGWRIITREPVSAAFAMADQISGLIMLVGSILGIVFIGIGWLLAGWVTKPLETIVSAVEKFDIDDTSSQIPQLTSNAEVASLSISLKNMVNDLRQSIEERKHIENSLRKSEAKLRNMMEKTSQGILLVNSRSEITLVNHYIVAKFGYTREALLNSKLNILVPEEYRKSHENFVHNYFSQPSERLMGIKRELVAVKRDGTIFPVEISLTPVELDDELYVMAFLIDISERKRLEEQELYAHQLEMELQKERDLIQIKERFVSLVSHEFRTPLAVIQSSVNMIMDYIDRLPKERVLEKLNIASEHIQRMSEMMEDALRFSKTSSGKTELDHEVIEIPEFIQNIVETMKMTDKGQHKMVVNYDEGTLYADRKVLDHIMANLISNAIKYSPDNSEIIITARQNAHIWQFSVEDEGIGFSEDDIPKLFEPFYRAPNAREKIGTGLGLSIVKEYVELHQGMITVASKREQGSRFVVEIPMVTTKSVQN